jgi:hypothetical protein
MIESDSADIRDKKSSMLKYYAPDTQIKENLIFEETKLLGTHASKDRISNENENNND